EERLAVRREGEPASLHRKDTALDARRQVAEANTLVVGSLQRNGLAIGTKGDVLGGGDLHLTDDLVRGDVDAHQGHPGRAIKTHRSLVDVGGYHRPQKQAVAVGAEGQ